MKSALQTTVSTFGVFTGLMGVEHGLGEILQGNVAAQGLVFLSWPNSAFFAILNGEPALSILPNMRITGILAMLFSLVYIIWVGRNVHRPHSGWVLSLVSILMLLFGGGLFPPVLGILLGVAAARIHHPPARVQQHFSGDIWGRLGSLWGWFFAAGLLSWLAMFPGIPVLSFFFGIESYSMIYILLACMFGFLILAGVTGYLRDGQVQAQVGQADFKAMTAGD